MSAPESSNLESSIVEVIVAIQELGGHPTEAITRETVPLTDLVGFDSQTSVEATTLLAQHLNCGISPKGKGVNLFVSENGLRRLSISEIADRMAPLLQTR